MGLALLGDWFNRFTAALVTGIDGMNISMHDFLATANSIEKLEDCLEKFLMKCEDLGVKISTKKFKTGSKVKFGGFLVTNRKGRVHIEADPGKLDKIRDFLRHNSKEDVASFIGLVKTLNNWSGAISMKMEKIRELNKKGTTLKWDPPHQEEFKKVKKHLMETTTIPTWDKSLPLRLYADAAKTGGLGYVLTQPEGEREHIIYCGLNRSD